MDLPSISSSNGATEQKTICIIGAGPAGLAALKVVLDTPQCKAGLWKPIVFEKRENVGGVWLPSEPAPSKSDVPPATPLYDSLTTNLPHPLMSYTDFSFPPSTAVFPHASAVQSYLEAYAFRFDLRPYIMFNTAVLSVNYSASKWVTKTNSVTVGSDLVIVCNGHYSIPRYPPTPGIADWLNSGRASHSMWYRHPLPEYGNTVLVVGAGPSGQDIASDLLATGRTITVIHSTTGSTHEDLGNLKRRARVSQYGSEGQVTFEDGTTESGIDHCILATGYEYSYPFLSPPTIEPSLPPPIPPLSQSLHNSTYNVFPLAQHIFPIQHSGLYPPTSLAFIGLLSRVSPFPLVEAQAKAVVSAFADQKRLDLTREAVEVMNRYQELRGKLWGSSPDSNEVFGICKAWHKFEPMEQYDYRDRACAFAEAEGGAVPPIPVRVPEWEKEMYAKKEILRKTWVALEKSGEAANWVRGVGEGGIQEWVDLLRKLVKKGEEDAGLDKAKL